MSINTTAGSIGTRDIGQLVQQLVSAADKNKDGNLSVNEFGSFLSDLIDNLAPGGLKNTALGSAPSSVASTATTATVSPAVTPTATLLPTPPGWDATKWADPSHHTTKYDVGHVLAKYPPTTAGLKQAWDELSVLYPNATFDGKDKISGLPGTGGPIDVLVGASHGGDSWSWQDTGPVAS